MKLGCKDSEPWAHSSGLWNHRVCGCRIQVEALLDECRCEILPSQSGVNTFVLKESSLLDAMDNTNIYRGVLLLLGSSACAAHVHNFHEWQAARTFTCHNSAREEIAVLATLDCICTRFIKAI